MPKPGKNETQEEFIDRCIPIVLDEGTASDGAQAAAICHSIWDQHEESKTMQKQIFKSSNIELKSIDEEKREVIAIASKEIPDRDGDIVRVGVKPKEGINIAEYKKNPVILFAHNQHDLPVAKATKVWKENKHLMVKLQFPEPEISSMGDSLYKLIKNDYIRSLSIGFRPKWDDAERIEKTGGWDFKSTDLFEISIVPVPANPAAMITTKDFAKAVDDGIIDKLELQEIELYIEEMLDDLIDEKTEKYLEDIQNEFEDTVEECIDEMNKVFNNAIEKSTDDIEEKSEQITNEFDPYAYLFEDIEVKKEDKSLLEEIYDLTLSDINDRD